MLQKLTTLTRFNLKFIFSMGPKLYFLTIFFLQINLTGAWVAKIFFLITFATLGNYSPSLDKFNKQPILRTSIKQPNKLFYKHLAHLFIFFWFKLTFRGKGFRVRKFLKNKKITFNFGRSHWTKLKINQGVFKIMKIRRQNYIWRSSSFYSIYWIQQIIRRVKPINRYTKRGLRIKKEFIKKRFGKISQMISSLHF